MERPPSALVGFGLAQSFPRPGRPQPPLLPLLHLADGKHNGATSSNVAAEKGDQESWAIRGVSAHDGPGVPEILGDDQRGGETAAELEERARWKGKAAKPSTE